MLAQHDRVPLRDDAARLVRHLELREADEPPGRHVLDGGREQIEIGTVTDRQPRARRAARPSTGPRARRARPAARPCSSACTASRQVLPPPLRGRDDPLVHAVVGSGCGGRLREPPRELVGVDRAGASRLPRSTCSSVQPRASRNRTSRLSRGTDPNPVAASSCSPGAARGDPVVDRPRSPALPREALDVIGERSADPASLVLGQHPHVEPRGVRAFVAASGLERRVGDDAPRVAHDEQPLRLDAGRPTRPRSSSGGSATSGVPYPAISTAFRTATSAMKSSPPSSPRVDGITISSIRTGSTFNSMPSRTARGLCP